MSSRPRNLGKIPGATEANDVHITMATDSDGNGRHRSSEEDHSNPNTTGGSSTGASHVSHMPDPSDSGGKDDIMLDHQQLYTQKRQSSRTITQGYEHQSQHYNNQTTYMNHPSPLDTYSSSNNAKLSGQHHTHIHGSGMAQCHIPNIVKSGKRMQVKNACTNCQKACKKCDDNRPCSRCIKYNISDTCINSTRKERVKGLKRGPYKRREDEFHDMTRTLSFQRTPHVQDYQPQYHIGSQQPVFSSKVHSMDDTSGVFSSISAGIHANMAKLPSLSELQLSLKRSYREQCTLNQSIPSQPSIHMINPRHQMFMGSNEPYQNIYETYQGNGSGSLPYIQDPRLNQPITGLVSDQLLNPRVTSNRGLTDAHLDYLTTSKPIYRPTPLSAPLTMFPMASQRPSTPEYYRLGADIQNQSAGASILGSNIGNYRAPNIQLYTPEKQGQLNTLPPITLPPLKLPQHKDYMVSSETSYVHNEKPKDLVSSRLDELSDLCSIIGPSNP